MFLVESTQVMGDSTTWFCRHGPVNEWTTRWIMRNSDRERYTRDAYTSIGYTKIDSKKAVLLLSYLLHYVRKPILISSTIMLPLFLICKLTESCTQRMIVAKSQVNLTLQGLENLPTLCFGLAEE